MDLGYGFKRGTNRISKERIQAWRHSSRDIDMKAFVWDKTQYFQVQDYSVNWVDVKIWDNKQRERFYHYAKEYSDEMGQHNYLVDKENTLYRTHHRGYDKSRDVIERLVKER